MNALTDQGCFFAQEGYQGRSPWLVSFCHETRKSIVAQGFRCAQRGVAKGGATGWFCGKFGFLVSVLTLADRCGAATERR
jgi:hypothetical protein